MNEKLTRTFYGMKRSLKRNTPTILTAVATVGVVATAASAVKATPKALELIDIAEKEKGEELTKVETVMVATPVYIPTLLIGASTIACIVGANILNKQQQAALTSAYALLDNSFKEYKKKVIEMYGEDVDTSVRMDIMKDKYDPDNYPYTDDKITYYDETVGRYFEATKERVDNAKYELNRLLAVQGHVSLNEWYELVGLPCTDVGDKLGWNLEVGWIEYGYQWIDFNEEVVTLDDGFECRMVMFVFPPTVDYY